MGSFEKLVVATVFFLSAIVLAVSLSRRDGEPEGAGPVASGAGAPAHVPTATPGPERATPPAAGREADRPRPPAPLLSTQVEPRASEPRLERPETAPQPVPEPPSDGRLRDRTGLERSPLEGRLLYTWKSGDTWTRLAERLYGSGVHAEALRVVNDDARPEPGQRVFVLERIGGDVREAADPRVARPAPAATPPTAPVAPSASAPVATADGAFVEHVVRTGETLSSISERYYGTPARWQRIHDANRDVLASPDRLTVGTKLRIP